jgi:hypothetical protein
VVTYNHRWDGYRGYLTETGVALTLHGSAIVQAVVASWAAGAIPGVLASAREMANPAKDDGIRPTVALSGLNTVLEMVESLKIQFRTLLEDFRSVQESVANELAGLHNEVQQEAVYERVYEDMHQLVVRSLARVEDRIEEYRNELSAQLGDLWHQLGDDSRRFLSSAEYLYRDSRGTKTLDFAPMAVEYCKVVETELWRRLYRPLLKHLKQTGRHKVTLRCGQREVDVHTDREEKTLTLGQLAYLFETSREAAPNPEVHGFLKRFPPQVQQFVFYELPGTLRKISNEYRNGSAHTETLTQAKVEEFRSLLLGRKDGATGLLRQIGQIGPVPA